MTTAPHNSPTDECDLVMKGGITSGVVYPPAVLKLRNKYRFRSIGGTSAGAIAATLTAAAEYDREGGGFDRFKDAQQQVRSGEFLFKLFRPSRRARPLFDTLLALRGRRRKGTADLLLAMCLALARKHPRAFWTGAALGAIVGVTFFVLVVWSTGGSLDGMGLAVAAPFTVLSGVLVGVAYGAYDLYRILNKEVVRNNFYGMCTGRGEDLGSLDETVLTDWLYAKTNQLAGKGLDRPLTFEDLTAKEVLTGENERLVGISLRMVTTNLNHGEPYVFPRREVTFLFKGRRCSGSSPKRLSIICENTRRARMWACPPGTTSYRGGTRCQS